MVLISINLNKLSIYILKRISFIESRYSSVTKTQLYNNKNTYRVDI